MSEIQERLVGLFASDSLRRKIAEVNRSFSDMELLRIAYFYSPDFDSRIENMRLVSENADDEIKAYAMQLVDTQNEAFEKLKKEELGVIYELYMPDENNNEKLSFCSSYKAALWLVVLKNREGGQRSGVKYRLLKRTIAQSGENEGREETNIAQATLLPDSRLHSVETDDLPLDCDGECEHCSRPCLYREDIVFPCFLANNAAVSYIDIGGERRYGIVAQECAELFESCRIISLDSPAITNRSYDSGKYDIKFIAPPFIEPVEATELPAELAECYSDYLSHLANEPLPTLSVLCEDIQTEAEEEEEDSCGE